MAYLPPPVTDLEVRLGLAEGTLTGPDRARADRALGDATTLALAEVSTTKAAEWSTGPAPEAVSLVVLKAARREFENPRGLTEESMGDRSLSLAESSGVYLTAREIATVRRAASGRRGGFVGSVRLRSAYEIEGA